jgi:hypothetical protein
MTLLTLALALLTVVPDSASVKVTVVVGVDRDDAGELTAVGIAHSAGCADLDSSAVAAVVDEIGAPEGVASEPTDWWGGYHLRYYDVPLDRLLSCAGTQELLRPLGSSSGFELREVWSATLSQRPSLWAGPPEGYRPVMVLSSGEASVAFVAPEPALRFEEVTVSPDVDAYTGEPLTSYSFTPEDGERLHAFTSERLGESFAMVMDGRVAVVAGIMSPLGDSVVVTQ